MRDETTAVTETERLIPQAREARAPFFARVKLSPLQKLTRAHLAVGSHPNAVQAMVEATQRIAQTLSTQVKNAVTCTPSLLPATLHPFSHLGAKSLFIILELGGDAVGVVELDALGLGALLSGITGANEAVGIPTRLSHIEETAMAWVVLSTLSELRKEACFASFSPRLVSLTLDRGEVLSALDGRRRHLAIRLDLTIGKVNSIARVLVPASWLQAKVDVLAVEPSPEILPSVLDATVPATCIVGSALLAPGEARALDAGDVILFNGVTQQTDGLCGPGRIVTPTFELRGTFTQTGFTLTRAFERPSQESAMSHADPTVPVEIEVELTRLRLPLHQLGTVRPGSIIPLHINAAQTVVVRIGDKAVARAELVEIEGEIGARIVSML